jgi:hypothetical protein
VARAATGGGTRCGPGCGKDFCGDGAAKRAPCGGGRLPLVCTTAGGPVACDLVPGGLHDLTYGLPAGATCYGDQGDNAADDAAPLLAETGGRPGPSRMATMRPTAWAANLARRAGCPRLAARDRQVAALGGQRLRVRATPGRLRQRRLAIRVKRYVTCNHTFQDGAGNAVSRFTSSNGLNSQLLPLYGRLLALGVLSLGFCRRGVSASAILALLAATCPDS